MILPLVTYRNLPSSPVNALELLRKKNQKMMLDIGWGAISEAMGLLSVAIWMCAQMPQVVENWRLKSVEGLSVGFLIAWIAGDISNLAGCLMTGQLGVQTVLACYYVTMDLVLTCQFYIYHRPSDHVSLEDFTPVYSQHDNSNRRGWRKLGAMRSRLVSFASVLSGASAAPTRMLGEPARDSMSINWGYAIAYFSTAMYLGSRLPQIWHNWRRKSTKGVSMMLFFAALMGNLTYTLSIVVSPQALGPDSKEFLLNEMSYILGAAGTMIFDFIILFQYYIYQYEPEELVGEVPFRPPNEGSPGGVQDSSSDLARLRSILQREPGDKSKLVLTHQSIYSSTAIMD